MMSSSNASSGIEDWISLLNKMSLKRNEINLLIMDYLISEGFKEAAERFKSEANIDTEKVFEIKNYAESNEQIDQRIAVRSAIESGNIELAIRLINDYYPELIDNNRHIYFKLQVWFFHFTLYMTIFSIALFIFIATTTY